MKIADLGDSAHSISVHSSEIIAIRVDSDALAHNNKIMEKFGNRFSGLVDDEQASKLEPTILCMRDNAPAYHCSRVEFDSPPSLISDFEVHGCRAAVRLIPHSGVTMYFDKRISTPHPINEQDQETT